MHTQLLTFVFSLKFIQLLFIALSLISSTVLQKKVTGKVLLVAAFASVLSYIHAQKSMINVYKNGYILASSTFSI